MTVSHRHDNKKEPPRRGGSFSFSMDELPSVAGCSPVAASPVVGIEGIACGVEQSVLFLLFVAAVLFVAVAVLPLLGPVLEDGSRLLLVNCRAVDIPCLFLVPVLLDVECLGIIKRCFRLCQGGVVSGVVSAVSVAVLYHPGVVLPRIQEGEIGASVFHQGGAFQLVAGTEQFHECRH